MPQTPERKREYNRQRQQERRGKLATVDAAQGRNFLQGTPYRDQFGDLVLERGSGVDKGNEHYWLRRLGEETATCTEFEFQGRLIGGCGAVKQYEGHLLDGGLDLGKVIADSPHAKEIQQKMPVTKGRER